MLTRMFAYFTLVCYLIVGTMAVRFLSPELTSINISTSYFNIVLDAPIEVSSREELIAPEMKFAEIKIPVFHAKKKVVAVVKAVPQMEVKLPQLPESRVLAKNELPFHEPITLEKIEMKNELPTNMVASYKDFAFEEVMLAKTELVADEVSTSMAASETVEPEFFEYPTETKKTEASQISETTITKNETSISDSSEVETQDVADLIEKAEPVVAETNSDATDYFDYSETPTTQSNASSGSINTTSTNVPSKNEPVAGSTNLMAFDYSRANQDVANQMIPTVTTVTTHKSKSKSNAKHKLPTIVKGKPNTKSNGMLDDQNPPQAEENHFLAPPSSYPVSISIFALGTDLKKLEKLQGYEVRFQDDLSEMLEDYGAGEVKFEAELAQPKMTRTVTLLKRGYIPVTTEIILEEGAGSVSIPMLEEDTLNDLTAPFERRGLVGALLVELDDETDVAKLDVPFGEVVKLDGDLKRTENENFRYQLFVGVQAGNAMVSYHRGNGEVVSKIIHVHENEMTYDANFYEDVVNEKIRLYEEELLAKESSPLIISGENVKIFATNSSAKKINNHTYKMAFGSSHLAGRRYLELNHQTEPVFVGIRDNNNVTVPSENFMRFILSKVEGAKLGNRCLVQVNLTKKAESFEVASESISQSLMTTTQILDNDGKFYDSLSDKTRKIIIIGEGQGAAEISPDAKINIKIQYQDGSVQFLNSYCSPNTYLVEQL